MGKPSYSDGFERADERGRVAIYSPGHPLARKDGFVLRSRLAMEAALGRPLTRAERVMHWPDPDPSNDECGTQLSPPPGATAHFGNLLLFEDVHALQVFRSNQSALEKANGAKPVPLREAVSAVLDTEYEPPEEMTAKERKAFDMGVQRVQEDVAAALDG